MPTPEEMRALSARFVHAVNSRDPQKVAASYTEDATYDDPTLPEPLRGREAIATVYAELFEAFPDASFEIVRDVGEGNRQAIEWVLRGTSRPIRAGQASGRIELKGFSLLEWTEDKIASDTVYYDTASLVQQSGVLDDDRA